MRVQTLHAALAALAVIGAAITGTGLLTVQATASTPTPQVMDGTAQSTNIAAEAPRGRWDPTTGTGELILDNRSYHTVFQGEDDIEAWRNTDGDVVSGTLLEGESGASEGDLLDLTSSIPADQATGRYSSAELTARVLEPRISQVTLRNQNGVEMGADAAIPTNNPVLVTADWNYVQAEDIQIAVVDQSEGITIEKEVLAASPSDAQAAQLPADFSTTNLSRVTQGLGTTGHNTAYWLLDFTEVDEGAYTLRIEGSDSLTANDAAWTTELSVGEPAMPTETTTALTSTTPQTETTAPATPSTERPSETPTTEAVSPRTPTRSQTSTVSPTQTTTEVDGAGFGLATGLLAGLVVAAVVTLRRL
ncbi:hypothetical protein ABSL23_06125 [Halobacterium sp. NMX12-1]|uniref:PGF-CTERM sorting domain-containing protein n=1 Tax=Halobacterium sp. NMX12-1 TaxID=3166650 RepID=A0AAU8CHM9_9EURY